MYITYILQNEEGKLYIGQTSNIDKRIEEHNQSGEGYTSKYRPWKLIWRKEFKTRSEAMKEEKFLKTGVGRDWIKKIKFN